MKKTTVYLDDRVKERLLRAAEEYGRSESEIIREGVNMALDKLEPPLPSFGIFSGPPGPVRTRRRVSGGLRRAVILVDTGALLASYSDRDRHHAAVVSILTEQHHRILLPFVLEKLDYVLTKLGGQEAELRMLDDVARGAYDIASFTASEVGAARAIVKRYADLNIGLADASIAVLAEWYRCRDVLTIDKRHFRAISGPVGRPFRILPFDAP